MRALYSYFKCLSLLCFVEEMMRLQFNSYPKPGAILHSFGVFFSFLKVSGRSHNNLFLCWKK